MTLAFEKPERHADWVAATYAAAKLTINALGVTDPASATKSAVSAYPTIKTFVRALNGAETSSLENRAWKWLSLTLAEAVTQFLSKLRVETELQGKVVDAAISEFLQEAMSVPATAHFDANIVENPAGHAAFAPARRQIPNLINKVTLWLNFDTERWQRVFDDCLASASFKMFAACHADVGPLLEAVAGPASAALRKDLAWARHYEWINKRFCEDPVFSPDGNVTTPLSDLYIRLRCYWHEECPAPSEDGSNALEKRWKAHLGDLHETVESRLRADDRHKVCVIAGGPGSGKSSFAKAVASEVARKGHHRVILIELQRMNLTSNLYRDIENHLKERYQPTGNDGSAGFPENPVEWVKAGNRPLLLVFDGLDEITHNSEQAKEIARSFVQNVQRLADGLTSDGTRVHALVLGRNAACQEGLKAAALPFDTMLNVAPIRELEQDDLRVAQQKRFHQHQIDIPEIENHLGRDQRPEYWQMWQKSQGLSKSDPPEAVTNDALSDLNVEPLLLHLLILSDYCEGSWKEAAENRNLVYRDILSKIHQRNVKERKTGMALDEDAFFLLMECLGLAAWRGNLRTGDEAVYNTIRDLHAVSLKSKEVFKNSDLKSMVLQTHARKVDGAEPGFEFIHKSFGEYLTARALITLGQRTQRKMMNEDDPLDEESAASEWVKLVGDAELTPELIRFLRDEARRVSDVEKLEAVQSALERLLSWAVTNGMPVQFTSPGSFRAKETAQRCAETALLAVSTSVAYQRARLAPKKARLKIDWAAAPPIHFLHRIHATTGGCSRLVLGPLVMKQEDLMRADLSGAHLSGADLSFAHLSGADLSLAKLSGADLSGAHMSGAHLRGANLSGADLSGAHLRGAKLSGANLSGADLRGANLSGAHLRGANLSGADLRGANFSGANLSGADLQSTELDACKFAFTAASSVDFTTAKNFDLESVKSIFGVREGVGLTTLPEGVAHPDFWHIAQDADMDELKAYSSFQAAFLAWRATLTSGPSTFRHSKAYSLGGM